MRTLIAACAVVVSAAGAAAGEWPQFRGPTGLGYTSEKNLPIKWGGEKNENVAWKAPLVGEGHATPIVWGDKVFVTTVLWPDGKQDAGVMPDHHVLCYSTADGKLLWDTKIEPGPWLRNDFRSGPGGGYAAQTSATDGKHVFVLFASSVMASLDFDGKIAWRKEIKPHTFDVTIGTSPVLFGDTVILQCTMANAADSRVVAFNKSDGEMKWETKLDGISFAHSTPIVVDVKGKPQLVVLASGIGSNPKGMQGFDPASGKLLWWCKAEGDSSSLAYGGGILYGDSGRGGNGTAIDPAGEGDLVGNIKWTAGPLPEAIASPIIVGDHVYRLVSGGVLKVWNLADGKQSDAQRLEGIGSTWASPVADPDGRIYFANGGKSYVVQGGPKITVLAVNDLGDPNHASMAVSNGRLYILGLKNLYCIAAH
jgi:outer membrane protein assembly factor BamB